MSLLLLLLLQSDGLDRKAVERLNEFRKIAGLPAVTLDPALSKGCQAHANYLLKNIDQPSTQGLGAHDEDPKLPGYTEEGAKAGKSSDIHFIDPVTSVDGWMATPYHRFPLVDPTLQRVGIGYVQVNKYSWICVMDVLSGKGGNTTKSSWPVCYPADKQKDVPLLFGGENPNPIPSDPDGQAGYTISVTFEPGTPVKHATYSLKKDKTEVACWWASPEKPSDKRFQRNSIWIMSKDPLEAGTTYTVTVSAKVGGKNWTKSWTFTTAK
jgi:hypothetical protein